jgi:two-component system, LuxR family, sensor kinase FixL
MVDYSQTALRLLDPSAGAAPVREALQAGIEQALRASELIRRLRSLVRQRTLRFESLPLRQIIDNAIRQEQAAIDSAGITVTTRWPQAAAEVQGDAVLLAQLFGNLLRNAVQAVETSALRPACIAVEVKAVNSQWHIAVSDSGPGLAAAQRSRAFQPVASAKPQGLGIGLAVCATIAEAHGGTVALDDAPRPEPELRGARFIVMLPRLAPEHADNDTSCP